MNQINNSITGLASSLFLNVGLTRIAEKLDPIMVQGGKSVRIVEAAVGSELCTWPCNFTSDAGQ